jgi:hypothetical protein
LKQNKISATEKNLGWKIFPGDMVLIPPFVFQQRFESVPIVYQIPKIALGI